MTNREFLNHSFDQLVLKHIHDENSADVSILCTLTGLDRWRLRQSLDRLEAARQVQRKKDDRGYIFVAAQ
jgi:hypothetical protein